MELSKVFVRISEALLWLPVATISVSGSTTQVSLIFLLPVALLISMYCDLGILFRMMKFWCIFMKFADKRYLMNLGITKDDFHAITWFTSWAVDADHGSDISDDGFLQSPAVPPG